MQLTQKKKRMQHINCHRKTADSVLGLRPNMEKKKKEMDGQRFERWTFRMQSEHSTN
jgi:hypothetical protein